MSKNTKRGVARTARTYCSHVLFAAEDGYATGRKVAWPSRPRGIDAQIIIDEARESMPTNTKRGVTRTARTYCSLVLLAAEDGYATRTKMNRALPAKPIRFHNPPAAGLP